jgi:hypothetical protein
LEVNQSDFLPDGASIISPWSISLYYTLFSNAVRKNKYI